MKPAAKSMGFRIASVLLMSLLSVYGVCAQDMSAPLDDNILFGGSADIVRVIDTETASSGTVNLVTEEKRYPVFLVEGGASVAFSGDFTPIGATVKDKQSLVGTLAVRGLSIDFLPAENIHFGTSLDATVSGAGLDKIAIDGFADMRASEFSRLYGSGGFSYSASGTPEFSLDELFVDAAMDRILFFRLGKQHIRWGVGTWFQPSDVLSLAAIDPDDPSAAREGPFAFKVDMPFGLNHASLYVVPSGTGDPGEIAGAARTDLVVGGWELSLGAFARSDMEARPRAMFMFTGTLGDIDTYGEAVAALGSDRLYVRDTGGGTYGTYTRDYEAVFQATVGFSYDWRSSGGLSVGLQAQGYYNGTGYADPSIQNIAGAKAVLGDGYDLRESGLWYAAGRLSLSAQLGEDETIGVGLSINGIANISDGSVTFTPAFSLSLGDQGSALDLAMSAKTMLGGPGTEYGSKSGTMVTPALSATIMDVVTASVQAPLTLGAGSAVDKADINFSLSWKGMSI